MDELRANRARCSTQGVTGMLGDAEGDNDDYNEVVCDGSHVEFYDFDKDEELP